jgi:hypothetical protein
VADVLSSGPERVRRRRRWATPVTVAVVAAAAFALASRSGGDAPEPPPAAVPIPLVTVRPAPDPGRTAPAPAPTYRLDGRPGAAPAGLRLLLGGERPGVLDLRSGRFAALPGLPAGSAAVEVRRVAGLSLALVPGPTATRAYAVPDGGRPVDLGPVDDALPMRDGTVLMVRCDPVVRDCLLSARTLGGEVRWQRAVPPRARLVQETLLGVVLWVYPSDGGQVRVEDPETGQPVRTLGKTYSVLTADDRRVAYQELGCRSDCRVVVSALSDGSRTTLERTTGTATAAAFSPDGRWLAIGFQGLHPEDPSPSADRDGHVAVADLASGEWLRVPGLATGSKTTPLPVWAPTGELVVAVGRDGVNRFAAWRPGDPRVTVLPARVDRTYLQPGMLAALA